VDVIHAPATDAEPCDAGRLPALTGEIFVIPLDGDRYIVYAPLRMAAFVANAPTVNLLADIQAGRREITNDSDAPILDLLRRLQIVDGPPEQLPLVSFEGAPAPTSVTLFLTTGCSLRCTYCYASAGDTPRRSMPLSVARSGIDFVLQNAVRRSTGTIEIAYHGGGEPTLNWATLTESMTYARRRAAEHGIAVVGALASNGVLGDSRIDWIVANLSSASISFDGLPELHDLHRPTVSGRGSSAAVIHTIQRFDAAQFDYGLRVTVTADAIRRLPESVEFICARFGARTIQVEPSYNLGRWQNAPSAETSAFIEAFREAQARARSHGRSISFSAARLGMLSNHFCGVTQDSFCLSPDGNVSGCYEVFSEDLKFADTFFYGRPARDGGYEFDMQRLSLLRRQSVEHKEFCRGCFAKWTCGGDCHHKSLSVNGGAAEFAGSDRCHIIRELTKDQLLDAIAAAGGLVWNGAGRNPYPHEAADAPRSSAI